MTTKLTRHPHARSVNTLRTNPKPRQPTKKETEKDKQISSLNAMVEAAQLNARAAADLIGTHAQ
jgi:hypothetical protein